MTHHPVDDTPFARALSKMNATQLHAVWEALHRGELDDLFRDPTPPGQSDEPRLESTPAERLTAWYVGEKRARFWENIRKTKDVKHMGEIWLRVSRGERPWED
jgi:hypothetical protein